MSQNSKHRLYTRWAWLPVVFVAFFVLGLRGGGEDTAALPPVPTGTAEERVLVYIGSSTCSFSTDRRLPGILTDIIGSVRESAIAEERRFIAVGIAKDRMEAGLKHLRQMADFDEVMSGRNWLNTGVLKYIYEELPGPGATPQVLVLDRSVTNDDRGIAVSAEVVLVRRVGFAEIEAWSKGLADGLTGNQ